MKKLQQKYKNMRTMLSKPFMKTLEYYFFTTLHLLVAFSLILGLFYIRFLPRVSRDLWQNMTHYQLFLTLFLLSCIIFNIYNTLKIIGYIKTTEPKGYKKKILGWLHIVIGYIYAILANFYDFLWFALEKTTAKFYKEVYFHYRTLRPVVNSFTNLNHSFYYFVVLFAIKILPKMLFVLALVYDVIVCQHFHYTFRCIPLLLIPLVEQFFLFVLKDYHKAHVFHVASFLVMQPLNNTDQYRYYLRPGALEMVQEVPYQVKDFNDFFDNHFWPTDQILLTVEKYDAWQKTTLFVDHVNLLLQAIRLIVYIFVLIYGII